MSIPAAGEPLSFAADIKPLFRARDQASMKRAFDLWSYDDVKAHAPAILERVKDGSMPCDVAWPGASVEAFERWIDTGFPV